MLTIILPGYSVHNKEWAYQTKKELQGLDVLVHEWEHWSKDVNFSAKRETERLLKEIGTNKVNILAKSIGVATSLELIPKISSQVNKVILCGIASVVNEQRNSLMASAVAQVSVQNLLCIQNEHDKYVPFAEAEKFYHTVNPGIKIISKPRSDHEYPYPEDFLNFFQN